MMKGETKTGRNKKIAVVAAVILAVVLVIFGVSGTILAARYEQRIVPRTSIAGIDVSGATPTEAVERINRAFDQYLDGGFVFVAGERRIILDRAGLGWNDPDLTNDVVRLDADQTVERAFARGHGGSKPQRILETAFTAAAGVDLPLVVSFNRPAASTALRTRLSAMETEVAEPRFIWSANAGRLVAAVQPGKAGKLYDVEIAVATLEQEVEQRQNEPITLKMRTASPTVSDRAAAALTKTAEELVNEVPVTLTYQDKTWSVPADTAASWLTVKDREGAPILDIDQAAVETFLKTFADTIEVAPASAKMQIENSRVTAFEPGRTGVAIDRDSLAANLLSRWIGNRSRTVALMVKTAEPEITTEKSNNLGIKEILGVGTSTFAGSPPNRIKNIRNSVRKLNGILIKPGEEFSLLNALKPFSEAGGYLPEKVIKGDRIKPEVGGGACQIGTTTFRAAMNSGLPITVRQNHSLVVKYYNDPKNGNPGTDATIYEPTPDFRFLNDTGNYILFQALMDDKKGELRFIFWGTSDGRKGYYSSPVVHKWYSPGAPQEIKTTDMPVGTKDCQNSFKGADTSFTYTVEKPDGTKTERVYTSHYRALPKICMVGATPEEVAGQKVGSEVIPNADVPAPPPATNSNTNVNTNTPQ